MSIINTFIWSREPAVATRYLAPPFNALLMQDELKHAAPSGLKFHLSKPYEEDRLYHLKPIKKETFQAAALL